MLINSLNGKRYVGYAKRMRSRLINHRTSLMYGKHTNVNLQQDWILNSTCWSCSVIEVTEDKNREVYWTLHFKSNESEFGYNLNVGRRMSKESIEKSRSSNLGKVHGIVSEETREKLSVSGKEYFNNPNNRYKRGLCVERGNLLKTMTSYSEKDLAIPLHAINRLQELELAIKEVDVCGDTEGSR